MNFKRLALAFLGECGFAWLMAGADAPSIQLKPQANINALDAIADQTHGVMKWSHGAFLYMDVVSGLAPSFHTLDREGQLISSATLNIPGASQFWVGDFDRGTDGSVVFAGGTYSAYGKGAPLVAWISANGQTERVIRTAPYYPHMISVALDGTVWTIGCEMIDHKADAPGLDPNAGVLRHFDNAGHLIGSFYPQSRYVAAHQTIWLQSGHLVAKNNRLSWYAPTWGNPGRYTEISLDSMTANSYHGLPTLSKYAKIGQLAVTDDGTASLSVNDPQSPQHWITYTFDRVTSKWIPAQVAVGGFPESRVVGSDADQLVLLRGQGATFFSMTR